MCRNNLKQLGIALHNYHETYNTFPPGWNAHVKTAGNGPRVGWLTSILPYVDQSPLFDRIDCEKPLPAADADRLLQMRLEVYRCPTDPTSTTNPMRGNYGTSNYSGNLGDQPLPRWTTGRRTSFWPGQADTPIKANGIMHWNSRVGIRDILDGTSNTFLVGERSVTSASGIWPGVGSNEFENDAVSECSHGSQLNQGPTSFSSVHLDGANFLFGDGSVHFINDWIDSQPPNNDGPQGTYQRLANRRDGFATGDF